MVRNRKLAKSISDVGWGMFVNFLDYKLKAKEGQLIEIGKFFPSSKRCSCCLNVIDELTLDMREWDCPKCGTHHDRDGNAALNIRNEGIRILENNGEPLAVDGFPGISKVAFPLGGGNPVIADGGCVRPPTHKGKGQRSMKSEAHTVPVRVGVG
ncbi:transposase [Kalymmatonema gypsitolerans NIES-4073]|nr:transposase [Scytonema sp. NIES-4073]